MSTNDKVIVPPGYQLLNGAPGLWFVVRERNGEVVFQLYTSPYKLENTGVEFHLWEVAQYAGSRTPSRLFVNANAVSHFLHMMLSIDKVVDASAAKREGAERELS